MVLRQLKQLFGKQKDIKEQRHTPSYLPTPSITTKPPVTLAPKAPRDDVRSHSGPRRYTNHVDPEETAPLEDLITANLRLADRLTDQRTNDIPPDSRLGSYIHSSSCNDQNSDRLIQHSNNNTAPHSSSADIRTQHVDSLVEDNLFASPTSTSQTTARHELSTSAAMASSSVIRPPGYRPASPSLLEGFDDLDTLPTRSTQNLRQTAAPPAMATMTTQNVPRFRYQLDPSLLGDFGDENSAASSRSAPQTSPATQNQSVHLTSTRPVQQRGYGPISASILGGFEDEQGFTVNSTSRSSTSRSSQPRQQQQQSQVRNANNPYVKIIEARQNAMTMAYLRNKKTDSGVDLPAFPTDDIG